ncbi:MAG: hypothetical protein SAK29_00815 [Scytonema sp. PMC 1069.18]|nr:hypothetical protein [Scytonema sp. PMC 1069.18]MEC4881765.1 hypothetical protein [Scytonema sp. PMC 1070.18]
MINTTATIAIKTINHTHDREGNLIAFGIAEFYYRGKEGTVADEVPYRSKGAPAVVINHQGEGVHGTAEGFIDLQVDNKGEYKEKIATFVIRNFVSVEPIDGLSQTPNNSPKPETPNFVTVESISVSVEPVDEHSSKLETPNFAKELLENSMIPTIKVDEPLPF